jgi:hypothetical protein
VLNWWTAGNVAATLKTLETAEVAIVADVVESIFHLRAKLEFLKIQDLESLLSINLKLVRSKNLRCIEVGGNMTLSILKHLGT